MIASMADVPVVPTFVAGTNNLSAAFWRKRPLAVRFGEPIVPADIRRGCASDKDAYMAISAEAMKRIMRLAEEDKEES
jgi:1-acyl-sn-glycerol-3-phosphate acyltransferase